MNIVRWLCACSLACSSYEPYTIERTESRTPCAENHPFRQVYWGDLHVHTALSFDAYSSQLRAGPAEAYAFARGEALALPPYDEAGVAQRRLQLDRPLDFAAITDHAEFFGEVRSCLDPESEGYSTSACAALRSQDGAVFLFGIRLSSATPQRFPWCDDPSGACAEHAQSAWRSVQDAAEEAYDRSAACRFTSLVGYEYSSAVDVSNQHRNILFRSAAVPPTPTSFFEAPTASSLWTKVDADCAAIPGCEVLMIPHNSNLSNGRMFAPLFDGAAANPENFALRQRMEPLMEVYQHKGDSECMEGFASPLGPPDELCNFEKVHPPDFEDCGDGVGSFGMLAGGCVSGSDMLRGALAEGLQRQQKTGTNPLKLGVIASTDTHNASPGAVSEQTFAGHKGMDDARPEDRLGGNDITAGTWRDSPGGLAGVWAQENSRDGIFEALKRREVFGTSGPRMAVRFFAGFGLGDDLCDRADMVEEAYGQGVPMGSDLSEPGFFASSPTFLLQALKDPGSEHQPGVPLQRLQIIKGWVDAAGAAHTEVHTVGADNGDFRVDPASCRAAGAGASSLCASWTDPTFKADQHAYYYARVIAYPSCRWSTFLCARLRPEERPAACHNPELPALITERAWTSPIWFTPLRPE
jgi:hypothetical protein